MEAIIISDPKAVNGSEAMLNELHRQGRRVD
jgi:hypothetical protein